MKSGARGVCDGLGEQVLPARDAVREELLVCCVERLQLLICYLHNKGRCDVQDDHRGLEVDRGTRMIVEELGLDYGKAKALLLMHGSVKKAVDAYRGVTL